jgi:hypothetical protein
MAFADLPKNREGPSRRFLGPHIFDRICIEHRIEHRLTKPYHPWTNGQAERMNRTIKDATLKVFHYDDLQSLKAHVLAFVTAYNFAKHLKALKSRTPFQLICEAWTKDSSVFKINPHHLIPRPHSPIRNRELAGAWRRCSPVCVRPADPARAVRLFASMPASCFLSMAMANAIRASASWPS